GPSLTGVARDARTLPGFACNAYELFFHHENRLGSRVHEEKLFYSRVRFDRVRRTSTACVGCRRCSRKTSVGLLQWTSRSPLGKRWPAHDAAERTALHRSRRRNLDRTGGLGGCRSLNPASALCCHGL